MLYIQLIRLSLLSHFFCVCVCVCLVSEILLKNLGCLMQVQSQSAFNKLKLTLQQFFFPRLKFWESSVPFLAHTKTEF